ncbi:hypothetical protein P7K49_038182 [Saguinus oedipus]|uniref:Uncharacterized protein n=1 Tax=Saguinus oedipus TaxID=9490 RepID=A0ABQ9TDY1_SAGOE|nr:hypothetical protein P7K49_038182 [Saguinus oedipus]
MNSYQELLSNGELNQQPRKECIVVTGSRLQHFSQSQKEHCQKLAKEQQKCTRSLRRKTRMKTKKRKMMRLVTPLRMMGTPPKSSIEHEIKDRDKNKEDGSEDEGNESTSSFSSRDSSDSNSN